MEVFFRKTDLTGKIVFRRGVLFATGIPDFAAFIFIHELRHYVATDGTNGHFGKGWVTDPGMQALKETDTVNNFDTFAGFALEALITTICWSIGIFPFTEPGKRLGTAALNQYRLFLAWIVISLIIIVFYHVSILGLFTTPQFTQYLFLGLSGIIGLTIGDYFSFSSFKILGPKLGSLYTTIAPGSALLAGFLILNQRI